MAAPAEPFTRTRLERGLREEGAVRAYFVRAMGYIEESIYFVVGLLLAAAAVVLGISAATSAYSELSHSADALQVVITLLDKGLVMFMVAELLHTVRITIREHTLAAEPFLIVGLIAGVRRVLVLTAETSERTPQQAIELAILVGLVLVMSVAILIWRRSQKFVEEGA